MPKSASAAVAVQAAVSQPIEALRERLQTVLAEIEEHPGSVSLSVDLARDLEAPVEASLAVPVVLKVTPDPRSNDFSVRIAPATRQHFYPAFKGTLHITPARLNSSVISLRGTYTVPLGGIGQAVDMTLLRGAAHSSLKRFLDAVIKEAARRART